MRELAKIRKVSNIRPIVGKDFIEQVNVDGWNVITKKGEFKDGDLCVYVEIDSLLPMKPEFEFLAKRKYIIKTMKMAGVRSEGIVFPLSILPKRVKPIFGKDVTAVLGITQHNKEVEVKLALRRKIFVYFMRYPWFRKLTKRFVSKKNVTSSFPKWIAKTDETRIQNAPAYLQEARTWVATEKLDGSSATYAVKKTGDKFEFFVCSRNQQLFSDNNVWHKIARKHQLEEHLVRMFELYKATDSLVIQGEIVGPKIQGNKYGLEDHAFFVFNFVVDRVSRRFDDKEFEPFGLANVPILLWGNLAGRTVDEVLDQATFQSTLNKDTLAEGMVFRSFAQDDTLELSFKAVSPQFLMRNDE